MDKTTKFENLVKYVKGEVDYYELQNKLTGRSDDDRESYDRYIQEIFSCFKDPDFYQYLISQNYVIETIQEFIGNIITFYLNEWDYEVASKVKTEISNAMSTIDDENKLKILNLREEDEYRDYNTIYNPITERMDNEFLKAFIISLSEEERIKFLLDDNVSALHLARFDNREIVEIFNSLSEENKLRILTDSTEIKDEDGIVIDRYIPLLYYTNRSTKFGKYKTLLAELIGDNLDHHSKIEVLKNSNNKYDYVLRRIGHGGLKDIISALKNVGDDEVDIINTYFLHEGDKEKLSFFGDNLKRLKDINDDILETVEFELLTEKYQELMPKLDIITCYPRIQQNILELNDNQYRVLIEILNIMERRLH